MTPDLEDFERQAEEELRQWSEQLEADAPRLQAEMDATIRSWERFTDGRRTTMQQVFSEGI